jgi:hypothetical protein
MKKLLLVLLLSSGYCYSQTSINAGGNTITTPAGSLSYTIGQIDFNYFSNTNTVIYLGVQQPKLAGGAPRILEVETVTPNENMVLTAYPNPTFDNIKIHLTNSDVTYNYMLFDVTGKFIKQGQFYQTESIISLENLPSAIYFLKVISENGFEKNIKIIKNEK